MGASSTAAAAAAARELFGTRWRHLNGFEPVAIVSAEISPRVRVQIVACVYDPAKQLRILLTK
jgi:hypothetical protein